MSLAVIASVTTATCVLVFGGLRITGESVRFAAGWAFFAGVVIPYGVATLMWALIEVAS